MKIVGRAASAASVIAMAGNKVMVSPTAQLMIHNTSTWAEGDYRVMEHKAEFLKGWNKSIANAYILKTGLEQEKLLELMNQESWLTAQQAVEYGFVDEIMFDEGNQLVASGSGFMLPPEVINKMRNLSAQLKQSPENTGQPAGFNFTPGEIQAPAQPNEPENQKEDEESVEIKNADELRQAYPDLVAQVEAAAKEVGKKEGVTEGAKTERQRIQAIDEISVTLDPALVNKAKYEEPMNAEQLAFAAIKADAAKGRQYLNDAENDRNASGTGTVTGQPGANAQPTDAEKKKAEAEAASTDIAEFANQRRKK